MEASHKILIVDDRQENLYITKETIKALMPECDVITALGAEEGLRAVTQDVSVIVADVQMPDMSGIELCRKIKAMPEFMHIPLFLITSHRTVPDMKVEGLEAGAMDMISRPLDSQELVAKLRVGLRVQQQEASLREERDVLTDQVEVAGRELAESDLLLRQISEHINEVFWMLDVSDPENYRVLYVSPAVEHVWQFSAEYLYAFPTAWYDCIHEEDKGRVAQAFDDFIRSKGEYNLEYRIVRPDGTQLDIAVKARIILNDDGEVYRAAGVARDVTEQKALVKQLIQTMKMESIGQLASGITHEINTPTQFVQHNTLFLQEAFEDIGTLIDEYAKLLEATASDPELQDIRASIHQISQQIDVDFLLKEIPVSFDQSFEGLRRISTIVQSIKTFAHPTSTDKIPVDINKLIEDVATISSNEWKYHSELKLDLAEDLPNVICSPDLMNQAVLNLVVNAAYTNSEKVQSSQLDKVALRIQSRIDGGELLLRVQDEGMGIPESMRARVFDLFFTTKKEGIGSGQGLTFVHRIIVEEHGGTITFTSEEGVGTTFELRLPLLEKSAG